MMNLYVQELAGPGGSVLLSDMFLNLHETKDPQSRQMPHVMVGLGAGKKKCRDFGARMLYGCIKIINMFYCL